MTNEQAKHVKTGSTIGFPGANDTGTATVECGIIEVHWNSGRISEFTRSMLADDDGIVLLKA